MAHAVAEVLQIIVTKHGVRTAAVYAQDCHAFWSGAARGEIKMDAGRYGSTIECQQAAAFWHRQAVLYLDRLLSKPVAA